MNDHDRPQTISRRKVVAGMAAAAGVSVAAAGGVYGLLELAKSTEHPQPAPDIYAAFIDQPVPLSDPESGLWKKSGARKIALEGQAVITPLKPQPSVKDVTVRALNDGTTIGFLLEWEDQSRDEHTIKINAFRDACGVLIGPFPVNQALWTMGNAQNSVTILHWKADWQLDIDAGFQDLEVAFPNVSFDFYPPLVGVSNPRVPDDYPEAARNRLPGWSVGNPISQPTKTTPVEKLRALGPGTLEELPTQNAIGRGVWKNGKWKVALGKPMEAADEGEESLEPWKSKALAFTVWSGADSDRGSRKSLTKLGQLLVEGPR